MAEFDLSFAYESYLSLMSLDDDEHFPVHKKINSQHRKSYEAIFTYINDEDPKGAIRANEKALSSFHPGFKLENFDSFTYTSDESRILLNFCIYLNGMGDRDMSLRIIKFLDKKMDIYDRTYPYLMIVKAYSYILDERYEEANRSITAYLDKGHEYILTNLVILFYLRGGLGIIAKTLILWMTSPRPLAYVKLIG